MKLIIKSFIFYTVITICFSFDARSEVLPDTIKIKTMSDDTAKVNLINKIADVFRDFDTEKGIIYANKALALALKLNYQLGIGEAHKALGIIYYRMGIYDASLDNNLKAISIFKELNEPVLLCKSYNNTGLVYFARIEYSKAKSYMLQGLKIANELNNNTEKSRIFHNLGLIEFENSDFHKALQYHYQSYDIAKNENDLMLMGYNYLSIGKCFLKLNKLDSAKVKIQESIEIFKKLNNPNFTAIAYNQYADFFINTKKYAEALKFADMAYKIGESIGNNYLILEASDLIAKAYLGIHDYENALKYKSKFFELSNFMLNESNIKSIAYIEAKFEYDNQLKELNLKKESEVKISKLITKIAILIAALMIIVSIILFSFYKLKSKTNNQLMHKSEEISKLNLKLYHLNNTKDKFFSIIAHDLRTPFNAIIGFSEILIEQIRNKNYENIEEYAVIIQNSSQKTMDLLQNLLDWARLQTDNIEFKAIDFSIHDLLIDTIDLLNDTATQKSIQIFNTIYEELTIHADKSMISTVLRNLISNAIKFSHPGGEIKISSEKIENEIVFSISDNGIGISKDNLLRMFRIEENFSLKGTQNEKGTGLGLILCKEFVEKHGGRIWVESEEGVGSTFYFTLP